MADEFKRLDDDDWEELFPARSVAIGKRNHDIRPLALEEIGKLTGTLKGDAIRKRMEMAGISKENAGRKIPQLAQILIDSAPEALEIAFQLHRDDIKRLPMSAFLKLADAAVEINLESQGGLEKNLWALGGAIVPVIAGALETLSSSSASAGTDSETSGDGPSDSLA
jgi:hypothetical protein